MKHEQQVVIKRWVPILKALAELAPSGGLYHV